MRFCNALVGRFRGGLALVNVAQAIVFSSMSGSALADAAGAGKLMQALMTREGKYTRAFAAALTAVAATIGPIIPPSIPLVVYSLISDASVGYLFLAGVIPGLLIGASQMALIIAVGKRRNFPVEVRVPLRELPRVTKEAFPALLMPIILFTCLYSGITTPTEAAAVAAAYALLIAGGLYRSIGARDIYHSLVTSARTTVSIGMLIAGAMAFNYVITVENIPKAVSAVLTATNLSQAGFLLLVNVILLVLGCFLEGTTIILVILPVLLPTARALGVDPVHFGVMAVTNIMYGLVTPPYGLLLFMMTKIANVSLRDMVREVMPFLGVMLIALLMITYIPRLRALPAAPVRLQGLTCLPGRARIAVAGAGPISGAPLNGTTKPRASRDARVPSLGNRRYDSRRRRPCRGSRGPTCHGAMKDRHRDWTVTRSSVFPSDTASRR